MIPAAVDERQADAVKRLQLEGIDHVSWSDWIVAGAWLSHVALALHVRSVPGIKLDDTAQSALKRLLVACSHAALDAGFLLPVLAVVPVPKRETAVVSKIREWSRDQEWHRGMFLLFVSEEPDPEDGGPTEHDPLPSQAERRIHELLMPRPPELPADGFPRRTDQWVMDKIRRDQSLSGSLRRAVDEAFEAFRDAALTGPSGEEAKQARKKDARQWTAVAEVMTAWLDRRPANAGREEPDVHGLRPAVPPAEQGRECIVQRVTELRIRGFRGFPKENTLNTDADIVLLTGPNGNGKSSMLEALLLALTGYHVHREGKQPSAAEPPDTLFSILPRSAAGQEAGPPGVRVDEFEIHASVELDGTDGALPAGPLKVTGRRDPRGLDLELPGYRWPLSVARSRDDFHDQPEDRQLDSRLCAFFQDRVGRLYDENSRGKTIRDVFEPVPPFARVLMQVLPKIEEQRDEKLRGLEEPDEERLDQIQKSVRSWSESFAGVVQTLQPDSLPAGRLAGEPSESHWQGLIAVFHTVLQKAGRTPSGSAKSLAGAVLKELAAEQKRLTRRAASERSKQEQEHLEWRERELKSIDDRFPDLEEDLNRFAVARDTSSASLAERRSLASLLRDLHRNLPRWKDQAAHIADTENKLIEVVKELSAVDLVLTSQRAEEIEQWLLPRQRAAQRRTELVHEIARFEREIRPQAAPAELTRAKQDIDDLTAGITAIADMEWLMEWHNESARQQRARVREALDAVEAELNALRSLVSEITAPSEELRRALETAANAVLSRFAMSEGLGRVTLTPEEGPGQPAEEELDVRRQYRTQAAGDEGQGGDGRGVEEFSSGQKSQVAIALMIAQNEMAQQSTAHSPGHRVLILDDVSTSYDLSNLTREVLLWRQLAYHPEAKFRRQLFIASHHEDLTNQLLDLLAPPGHGPRPGSMRLLRFKGWKRDSGPEIENFRVVPAPEAEDAEVARPRLELLLDQQFSVL